MISFLSLYLSLGSSAVVRFEKSLFAVAIAQEIDNLGGRKVNLGRAVHTWGGAVVSLALNTIPLLLLV